MRGFRPHFALICPLALCIGCATSSSVATQSATNPPPPTGVALLERQQTAAAPPTPIVTTNSTAPTAQLRLIPNPMGNGPMLPPTASLSQWSQPTQSIATGKSKTSRLNASLLPMATAGDASAAVALARSYAGGEGGLRDYDQAAAWYRKAMGDTAGGALFYTAEGELGAMLLLGRSTSGSRAGALAMVKDSAAHGDAGGMAALGLAYVGGLGVGRDYATAETWLRNAQTTGGAPSADTVLGTMYLEGWGVPQNVQTAYQLFTEAAQAGDDDAWVKLGELYMYGIAVPKDYAQAKTWFKKAEARDNPLSYFALAELYSRGWGMDKNLTEAYVLYRVAATEGFPPAQGGAAFYNATGTGILKNPSVALQWAQKGSAAGDPVSEVWLKRLTP